MGGGKICQKSMAFFLAGEIFSWLVSLFGPKNAACIKYSFATLPARASLTNEQDGWEGESEGFPNKSLLAAADRTYKRGRDR